MISETLLSCFIAWLLYASLEFDDAFKYGVVLNGILRSNSGVKIHFSRAHLIMVFVAMTTHQKIRKVGIFVPKLLLVLYIFESLW